MSSKAKDESGDDFAGFLAAAVVIGAVVAYLSLYHAVNFRSSQHQLDFAFNKIGNIWRGEHNFPGYLFLAIIFAGAAFQIRAWTKDIERKRWDPLYWPVWGGLGFALIGLLVYSLGIAGLWGLPEPIGDHASSIEWADGIFGGLLETVFRGALAAVVVGVCIAAYLSVLVHYPYISLFTGILVTLSAFVETGEIDLVLMYRNFLDWVSIFDSSTQGAVAIVSLVLSLCATIYRGLTSFDIYDFDF